MSYITLDQAKQYLGDIYLSAYINVVTEAVDETILQDDIDGLTGVIDGYVKQTYDKTITGTQSLTMLRSLSEQLLYAKAYERFDSSEVPDYVTDRYNHAIFRLRDIKKGDFLLPDEVQSSRSSPFNFAFNSPDSTGKGRPIFDRDSMSGI